VAIRAAARKLSMQSTPVSGALSDDVVDHFAPSADTSKVPTSRCMFARRRRAHAGEFVRGF
jgi:hypothetical protein